jgi:hypothetical protein
MYNLFFPGNNVKKINEAPHWRVLKQYGGDLTIESFRDQFNVCEYKYHSYISDISRPLRHLYEKKIHF